MAMRGVPIVVTYQAYSPTANAYVSGDASNHVMQLFKDGVFAQTQNSAYEVNGVTATGLYAVALATTETQANFITVFGNSSNKNVILVPMSVSFDQIPNLVPGSAGGLLIAGSNSATTGFSGFTVTGTTLFSGVVLANTGISGSIGSVLTVPDLTVTAWAENSSTVPTNATIKDMVVWNKMLQKNQITQTQSSQVLWNAGASTIVSVALTSDNGSMMQRGQWM